MREMRDILFPFQDLAGDDTFMSKSREEDFNDPPDVIIVDEFGEKFDSAVSLRITPHISSFFSYSAVILNDYLIINAGCTRKLRPVCVATVEEL